MPTLEPAYCSTAFSFGGVMPEPGDRRGEERQLTTLRVAKLVTPDGEELCLIRNISSGGVMAHVYSRRDEGERVAIEIRNDRSLSGTIRWKEGTNIGISFDERIDVAEVLAVQAAARGVRHRAPRLDRQCTATLRLAAQRCRVEVRNVSQGGAGIVADHPLLERDEVILTMDGFHPVPGIVRWVRGSEAGIEFDQPIRFTELIEWLVKSAPVG